MSEHPIQGLMTTAMESLKEMIDVNTIIGDPVETPDGSVILTVSKVGFGFAAGGSEFKLDGSQSKGQDQGQGQGQGQINASIRRRKRWRCLNYSNCFLNCEFSWSKNASS